MLQLYTKNVTPEVYETTSRFKIRFPARSEQYHIKMENNKIGPSDVDGAWMFGRCGTEKSRTKFSDPSVCGPDR